MIKVYSFDVFDTSLLRRIAVPSDVFRLVAKRIAHEHGQTPLEEWLQDFAAARVEAQQQALAAANGREITLAEIWEFLNRILSYLPKNCGPEDEIAVERELLEPNRVIACRITELRARGARIVFASDTYLPAEFVRGELIRHEVAESADGFYVSSALGVTKHAGGLLFQELLRREGVAAKEVHHVGDNPEADKQEPKKLGMKTTLVTDTRLNTWERAVLSNPSQRRGPCEQLAGAMRTTRLATPPPRTSIQTLVSSFLGPAILVWAGWVLGAAQRDGVSRLYFASRDCYLLWRVARLLAPQFSNIDCRYLKISRRAVFLPSVLEVSPTGMPWVRIADDPAPLEKVVNRLGLEWPEVASTFSAVAGARGGSKLLATEDEWRAFWNIVSGGPILGLIRKSIDARRGPAVAFLEAEGLLDPVVAGIVDIGWTSKVLVALHRILNRDKAGIELNGYYLGLFLGRVSLSRAGQAKALFYQQPPDYAAASGNIPIIFPRQLVLDEVLGLAPHGTAIEYRISGGRPEAHCAEIPDGHAALVEAVADAVEGFCADNAKTATDYADGAVARELLGALFDAWCAAPSNEALHLLMECTKYATDVTNPLSEHLAPLIEPWRLGESVKNLVPGRWRSRLGITVRHGLWAEASLLRSGPLPATVVRVREAAAMTARRWRGRIGNT